MPYYVKGAAPCIDCGTPVHNRQDKSRAPLCMECGIRRAVATMVDTSKRSERRIARDARAGRKAKRG